MLTRYWSAVEAQDGGGWLGGRFQPRGLGARPTQWVTSRHAL